jgi:ubiquitin carboxyl-terminal hydrolase 7
VLTFGSGDELLREGKHPDPQRYYEFLHNKITLKFLPKYPDQTVKDEFQCVLSKTMKYDQIAAKVADHLKVQPTHLRLWPTTNDGRPRQYPLKRNGPVNIISQMIATGGMPLPPIVFYEVLEMSLADMESRREITVTWLPDGANVLVHTPFLLGDLILEQEPVTLLVNRQATMDEIAQSLVAKHASIPAEMHDRIRLFEARQHRDYREFQPTQNLSMAGLETSYGSQLFAEPIPLEEEEAGELDKFIVVVHFQKEFTRLHGVPIKFVVKPVCPPSSLYVCYSVWVD